MLKSFAIYQSYTADVMEKKLEISNYILDKFRQKTLADVISMTPNEIVHYYETLVDELKTFTDDVVSLDVDAYEEWMMSTNRMCDNLICVEDVIRIIRMIVAKRRINGQYRDLEIDG